MSARGVSHTRDTMVIHRWLAITSEGGVGVSVNPPSLGPGAIAMRITIEVPKALFTKPHLEARITVPASAGMPTTISAETVSNIENAVRQATGLMLSVRVAPDDDQKG